MRKKNDSPANNAKIAIVFFTFLIFAVGISLSLKIAAVIKDGQFDNSRRFTLTMTDRRNSEVISLSPGSKNIVIFKLNDTLSPVEAGRLLGIPIDGFIVSDSLDLNQKMHSLFFKTILNYNKLKTNLTVIDLFRMAMFARAIPESSINEKIVGGDTGELELNQIVGRLVNDAFMERDRQTIQIVNATGISGLGSRLARLITNMGGNVIIVATENNLKKKSTISYVDEKNYTVEKLQKVLGYEVVKGENNAISDITIVIGKDKVNVLPF